MYHIIFYIHDLSGQLIHKQSNVVGNWEYQTEGIAQQIVVISVMHEQKVLTRKVLVH